MQKEVYVLNAVRTAIGNYGGALRNVPSRELSKIVISEVVKRAKISPENIDEVIMGEVRQSTEAGNMARVAALMAGIPETTPAFTVNRLCASSMQAVRSGWQEIICGDSELVIAGGSENMSRAVFYIRGGRFGDVQPSFVDSNVEAGPYSQPPEIYGKDLSMGITAENVAQQYQVSREDQDAFAFDSQQKAIKAIDSGRFADEIVSVEIKERKGTKVFNVDEFPRRDISMEALAKLKPVFKKEGGTVTAGNACGRNDGGSAVLLGTKEKAKELGIEPMAKILDISRVGLSPYIMGVGPIPAVQDVLKKTGLKIEDIELVEMNEAFASQALACARELNINPQTLNVNGGGIALGHPMGATGARLITSLVHELVKTGKRYGIATLCIGGGQGMATLVENMRR